MKINKFVIGTVAGVSMLLAAMTPAFAANTTVVVKQSDLDNTSSNPAVVATDGQNKWFMYNDTNDTVDNTLGSFVFGPGTSPNGLGSVEFTLGASPLDRKNIATFQFSGTKLSTLTAMSYTAYSHSGVAGPNESPFLNFNVDFSGTSSAFQGRLVYVPSANSVSVPQDTWNNFDVISGGTALWTWSHFAKGVDNTSGTSDDNQWPDGNTNEFRTWNDIVAAFPDARLLPVGGWLGVRVGEPGPTGYTGNIASFALGTSSGTTTYEFEPSTTPTTFAQCKNGGWKTFNNPSFSNEGFCVAYVAKHMRTVNGSVTYTAGFTRHAIMSLNSALNSGVFFYYDAHFDWYTVKVTDVNINGNTAWFAGQVTNASNHSWIGNWLFAKVLDNSPDQIWGSFTTQTTAENGVTNMSDPTDGPFNVTSGGLTIH